MPRQAIINADDFGLSLSENALILRAFEIGVISSATAMAKMQGFSSTKAHPRQRGTTIDGLTQAALLRLPDVGIHPG